MVRYFTSNVTYSTYVNCNKWHKVGSLCHCCVWCEQGLGTDEGCLVEIICTRSNTELQEIVNQYQQSKWRPVLMDYLTLGITPLLYLIDARVSQWVGRRPTGGPSFQCHVCWIHSRRFWHWTREHTSIAHHMHVAFSYSSVLNHSICVSR